MPPMMTLRLQKQWRAEMASTCFMPLLVCLLSRMYSQRENWWCRLTYGIGVKHTHRKTLHVLQHDSGAAGTLSANIWESQCLLALRKSWTQQDVGVPAFFFFFFQVGWSQTSDALHLFCCWGTVRVLTEFLSAWLTSHLGKKNTVWYTTLTCCLFLN